MNLPRSGSIRKAFKAMIREIKLALKEINSRAAKRMARGDYAGAQTIMSQAQQVQQFADEVRAFQKRVSQLKAGGSGPTPARVERHADWEYYQPILQCLFDFNGDVTRDQVERLFIERFDSWILPGDRAVMSGGKPRWMVMIGRSKKHLITEGFVAAPSHLTWRITAAGRKAAQQEAPLAQRS